MRFQPDYTHFERVMRNQRPKRLPLYEHIISPTFMERVVNKKFAKLAWGTPAELAIFFQEYCGFFREMTYDVVTYESCITPILPGHGAIVGGKPGPIQSRADFEKYPWNTIPDLFWKRAEGEFSALVKAMPEGMKAVGGVGNGVFEIAEDLVGLEYLPFMQVDDPNLYAELFQKIGDIMVEIWNRFLGEFSHSFVACRFGDDLGFKSSLLTNPATLREQIFPQYHRIIERIHASDKPFLWHSCGCIFEVMDDMIALGIDAKHSNEDAIAPYEYWIRTYGDRIGLVGGFDMDFLCRTTPNEIYAAILELGRKYRASARGYALGSGNSIPDYVPVENYLAMVKAAQKIREEESVLPGSGSALVTEPVSNPLESERQCQIETSSFRSR